MKTDRTVDYPSRRQFLRSAALIGTGAGLAACEDGGILGFAERRTTESGTKFIRIDLAETDTGTFLSLDANFDLTIVPGEYTSNPEFCGYSVDEAGDIEPLCVDVESSYANALSLQSVGENQYRLMAGGVPQPAAAPYEITYVERQVPDRNILVLTGQIIDPAQPKRFNFSITHNPAPAVVPLVIVAAGAVLCLYLIKSAHANCAQAAAIACAQSGGVAFAVVKIEVGWGGCSSTCSFRCVHDQGSGS